MSVQGRARLCTLAPVFHLQDVGQNVGDGPVKLKRNLLVHLGGVVNRARQSRELDHFHLILSGDLANIEGDFIGAFATTNGAAARDESYCNATA